jgi:hypothetical protein
MSLVLGKRGDKEPIQCGICARAAKSVGYMPSDRHPILWLCDDTFCISQAKWIYGMKAKDLDYWENRAVDCAAHVVTDSICETVMTMLWERRIHNLNDIDGEKYKEIVADANKHKKLNSVLKKFLLEFSGSLKAELESRDPPF